ncbi:hypothetical protein AK830_g7470 [Neonectria ditissima]|uniref:GS catalytic domain-containing protein n=1 Tax=Neonectria ditissima TaxID=78410 RepID=A0A0N8H6I8_9HYPO|nr:hypothetical protein AK830_g7470 [Neonectria ditissima]
MISDEEDLEEFLQVNSETAYIRLQWIDFSGVLRTRFLPAARCLQIARGYEDYHVPQVSMITPISTAPRCFPTGNDVETWVLRPDWSSLRICGFRQTHASAMCFLQRKGVMDPYGMCPRTVVYSAIKGLERQWGTLVMGGFEIEVMLLDPDFQPLNQPDRLSSYQTTAGLRGETLQIIEDIVDNLKDSSIDVHHFHTETQNQIEIALRPEPLLDAIDSLVLAQETIRTVFIQRNIKAAMAPKPLLKGPTNGIHMHLSLDTTLAQPYADHFLAGTLSHVPSLCAFGMANFDGYVRTTKDAAGEWIGFGTENRDLPVRKVNNHHWEFRMMDGTSNPYLFAAAVLLAGSDGLSERAELTWKDCRGFPHSLDEAGRAEYQLERMPNSLHEALESLKVDSVLRTWMPKSLMRSYISLKEKEVEVFKTMPDDERRLRFLEYF